MHSRADPLRSTGTSGPEDAGIERARDRLAEALFAQFQARRAAPEGSRVAALFEATRRVEACEAWLGLLERPLPLKP